MSKIAILLRHVGEDRIVRVDWGTSIGEVYALLEKDTVDHIEILEQKFMPEVEDDE